MRSSVDLPQPDGPTSTDELAVRDVDRQPWMTCGLERLPNVPDVD